MQTALDAYLAASQQSLQANKDLMIATVGLGCAVWAEALAPFYRTAWDALDMMAKIALPNLRAADVVQFGAFRDAKVRKLERRAAALRG